MSHNERNFYQLSSSYGFPLENVQLLDLKNVVATAAQEPRQNLQNYPFVSDGVFWNTNRALYSNKPFACPQSLDPLFQNQLLREHRLVIKVALNSYLSYTQDSQIEIERSNHRNIQSWGCGTSEEKMENFINELRYYYQFKQMQLEKLSQLLKQNPEYYRIYEKFSELVPASLKGQFYYLAYKGLELNVKLQEKGEIDYTNIDSDIQACLGEIENQNQNFFEARENPQIFQKMLFMIVYTIIMYTNGKSRNKFYTQISDCSKRDDESILKIRLSNSDKCFFIQQKEIKPKKIVFLKRSTSYPIAKQSKGRKRIHCNQQI